MNKENLVRMHNRILFYYKEKQNNERRLTNLEVIEERLMGLESITLKGQPKLIDKTT